MHYCSSSAAPFASLLSLPFPGCTLLPDRVPTLSEHFNLQNIVAYMEQVLFSFLGDPLSLFALCHWHCSLASSPGSCIAQIGWKERGLICPKARWGLWYVFAGLSYCSQLSSLPSCWRWLNEMHPLSNHCSMQSGLTLVCWALQDGWTTARSLCCGIRSEEDGHFIVPAEFGSHPKSEPTCLEGLWWRRVPDDRWRAVKAQPCTDLSLSPSMRRPHDA